LTGCENGNLQSGGYIGTGGFVIPACDASSKDNSMSIEMRNKDKLTSAYWDKRFSQEISNRISFIRGFGNTIMVSINSSRKLKLLD